MKDLVYIFVCTILFCFNIKQYDKIKVLRDNQEALMDSSKKFKISDSLNAIKTANLQLSLSQYKKYHSNDANLINQLKGEKPEVIIKPEVRTEYKIKTVIKDSVIYKDTLKSFCYNDKWYNVNGILSKDSVDLSVKSYDELLIVESLQKKKFLFFKLPISIFGYKRKVVNVISKNPNSTIVSSEYISIK